MAKTTKARRAPIYSPLADPSVGELRAFIYDRNSRVYNGRGKTSTADQNADNRLYCASLGAVVVAEYSDAGKSASRYGREERKDFEGMMERLEAGIRRAARHAECDILVVWAASRAARDLEVYVRLRRVCEEGGILFSYNGTVYDMSKGEDRKRTAQDAVEAEAQSDHIRDGILRTTRANAQRGRPHGRIPYGYRREYDPETGELLRQVPHEAESKVVAEIAERIAGGQSCRSIAADLNGRGVPAPGTEHWTAQALPQLILKPSRVGQRQHQGHIIGQAGWDGIIPEDVFYACKKILEDPDRLARPRRESTIVHLLSGIPICGVCGPAAKRMSMGRNSQLWSYICKTCYGVSVREWMFDGVIQAALLARISRKDYAAALRVPRGASGAVRQALTEAAALEAQLADARRLAAKVVDGRLALSAASLAQMEMELAPRIEQLRESARDASIPPVLLRLAGPGAPDSWGRLELVEKRAVIRAVMEITLHRAGQGARKVTPDRYSIRWLI